MKSKEKIVRELKTRTLEQQNSQQHHQQLTLPEVVLSDVVLLLSVVNRTQTVPRVVMTIVYTHSVTITLDCLVKIFI